MILTQFDEVGGGSPSESVFANLQSDLIDEGVSATWSFEYDAIVIQDSGPQLSQFMPNIIETSRVFAPNFEYRILSHGEAVLRGFKRLRIVFGSSNFLNLQLPVASDLSTISELFSGKFCFFYEGRYVARNFGVEDCQIFLAKNEAEVPCASLDLLWVCCVCDRIFVCEVEDTCCVTCRSKQGYGVSAIWKLQMPDQGCQEPRMSESGFDGHDFAVDANSMHNKDWVERVTYSGSSLCNFPFRFISPFFDQGVHCTWKISTEGHCVAVLTFPRITVHDSRLQCDFKAYGAVPLGMLDNCPWFFVQFPAERHALVQAAVDKDGTVTPGWRVLDLFSGIGGWQTGLREVFGTHHFVAVDRSLDAGKILARNFEVPVLRCEDISLEVIVDETFLSCVVVGNIEDRRWWGLSLNAPFQLAVGSPACQPWSGASTQQGLTCVDGVSFTKAVLVIGAFRPAVSTIENVGALVTHQHFRVLEKLWRNTVGVEHIVRHLWLERVVPFKRHRIILCSFEAGILSREKKAFGQRDEAFNFNGGIFWAGAVCNDDLARSVEVAVSNEIIEIASKPDFLPHEWVPNNRKYSFMTEQEVLEARIVKRTSGTIPTLMAAYRNQHVIRKEFLKRFKLLLFFVEDKRCPRGFRFLHSFEAAKLLGFPASFQFPIEERSTVSFLGNCMAPVHVVMLFRWFTFLGVRFFVDEASLGRFLMDVASGAEPITGMEVLARDGFRQLISPVRSGCDMVQSCVLVSFSLDGNDSDAKSFHAVHLSGITCREVINIALPKSQRSWRILSVNCNPERRWFGGVIRILLPLQQFVVHPFGILCRCPFETLGGLCEFVDRHFSGGFRVWQLRVGNKVVGNELFLCEADRLGVLRFSIFAGLGGAKTIEELGGEFAKLLIARGVPESCVKDRVGLIIKKIPQQKLVGCLKESDVWKALKLEANEANVQLVTTSERENFERLKKGDTLQKDDPWKNYKPGKNRARKHKQEVVTFQDAILDIEFFQSACSLQPVSLQALYSGQSGMTFVKHDELLKNFDRLTKERLTVEPALVIAPGFLQTSEKRVSNILAPAFVNNRPVAMRIIVIQVGDQLAKLPQFDQEVSVNEGEKSTVVMVQVQRDEATEEFWPLLQSGLQCYLKAHHFKETKCFQNCWSSSFFQRKFRTTVDDATHWHCVARVYDKHLFEALKIGGLAGVYLQPKGFDRSNDERFRVVVLPGESQTSAFALLSKVPDHLGLAKTQANFGIRVKREDYCKVKKLLRPDCDTSDEEEHLQKRRWALLNVPDNLHKKSIKSALCKIGWNVAAIRPAGWRTWHVFCDEPPSSLSFTILGSQVVIASDVRHENKSLFSAGSMKEWKQLSKVKHEIALGHSSSSSSGLAGAVSTEVTSKFDQLKDECKDQAIKLVEQTDKRQKQTDEKLKVLEAKVEELTHQTKDKFDKVEQSLQDLPKKFDAKIQELVVSFSNTSQQKIKELDESSQRNIQALEKRQSEAITSQFGALAAQFDSLKEWMMTNKSSPAKAKSPEHKKGKFGDGTDDDRL